MSLTKEEKMALLRQYIDPSRDFVKTAKGEILLSKEASRRIADHFKIELLENGHFKPAAICDYIMQREMQRLAAADSIRRVREKEASEKGVEDEKISRVVDCIKKAVEEEKTDYFIALALEEECSNINLSLVKKGIEKAKAEGLISSDVLVKKNLAVVKNRNAVVKRFTSTKMGVKNPTRLVESLSDDMLGYYTKNALNLGHLIIALQEADLPEEIIDASVELFYDKYEKVFVEKFSKATATDEFVEEIYDTYLVNDSFDAGIIVEYLGLLNKDNINVEEVAYRLYQKEGDEEAVCRIITTPNITVSECVQRLKDLDLQYPDYCLKRTFGLLKEAYDMPYDEILRLYSIEEDVFEEEIEELKPIEGKVTHLNEEGDDFVEVADTNEAVTEEEITPRRLKIIKKEKEVKTIEKKKTLATLLIAAGFIPVAVLSLIFKTDPLVAAGNCVTALSQLSNGIGLEGILPSAGQLTTLLAGMGTTFVGFVKYLKNKKKLKGVKEELEQLEMEEQEEVKKGRR